MEEIYVNAEYEKSVKSMPSTNQMGPRSSERRFYVSVIFCLGLLSVFLLAGLIGLGVTSLKLRFDRLHEITLPKGKTDHDSKRDSLAELSTIEANLTERLQASDDQLSSASKERDRLNASLTEMTKKLDRLQRLSKQKKTCPAGWKMFSCACFFFSTKSDSWERSRQDCTGKGADLVVIKSREEQDFLSKMITEDTWIGLSDRDIEGIWKWTDGSPLTQSYWWKPQPDNGNGNPKWGEEDCAHLQAGAKQEANWNDRRCNDSLKWICEKMA